MVNDWLNECGKRASNVDKIISNRDKIGYQWVSTTCAQSSSTVRSIVGAVEGSCAGTGKN